jgi:hypothetical protein
MNPRTKARNADGAPRAAADACTIELLESRRHFDAAPVVADVQVVMNGLDSPRGLAFDPRGALYVAEAGRGGGPDAPSIVQRGTRFYYGTTGAVSRLWNGRQERVVSGLPSLAMADGTRGTGPSDVSFRGAGQAYVTIGLEGDPALRGLLGDAGSGFGQLIRAKLNGHWEPVASIADYEAAVNPDGRVRDSNPYSVLTARDGEEVVVDAGGNSLLQVGQDGSISTLAVIPPLPPGQAVSNDPVPTSIAVGPDGAYYVGSLSGAPFRDGAANVYRVVPGEEPAVFLGGFKMIVDLAFDAAGDLYVLQHASGATGMTGPGSLVRVAPDGTRSTVLGGLNKPTSVAVGPDGAVYVTTDGLSPGAGQVLRLTLSEPAARAGEARDATAEAMVVRQHPTWAADSSPGVTPHWDGGGGQWGIGGDSELARKDRVFTPQEVLE